MGGGLPVRPLEAAHFHQGSCQHIPLPLHCRPQPPAGPSSEGCADDKAGVTDVKPESTPSMEKVLRRGAGSWLVAHLLSSQSCVEFFKSDVLILLYNQALIFPSLPGVGEIAQAHSLLAHLWVSSSLCLLAKLAQDRGHDGTEGFHA